MGPEVIRVQGVRKVFNGHPVLDGINLAIRACETVSVLGGSGTGKSTLLKLIAGLIKPDRGRILLFGRDIIPLNERRLLPLRRRMGFVFQEGGLFDSLSVFENIAFPLRLYTDADDAQMRRRVATLLGRVGLAGIEERYPAELSGGMKKRVAIARALALQPEMLLFDEPTAGLDPTNARMICELIAELRSDLCVTSVVVTHDLHCAFSMSNRIAFLHRGRIVEVASPEDFRNSSRPEVQAFLRGGFGEATTGRPGNGRVAWKHGAVSGSL